MTTVGSSTPPVVHAASSAVVATSPRLQLRIGVVPAAGRGLRASPKTVTMPKPLIEVGGKPIAQWNLELMRDQLGIREVYFIIGYLGDQIRQWFGDGRSLGMTLHYVTQGSHPGIGGAIMSVRGLIDEPFLVILGDELYVDSNHHELLTMASQDSDAICAFLETDDIARISRNYCAEFVGSRISHLIEKPKTLPNRFMGCGTYVFTPKVFDAIERTPPSALRGEVEITDVLSQMAAEGVVSPFFLKGRYLNINNVEDIHNANYVLRHSHFTTYRVSVIIPAFNEAASIAAVVQAYQIPQVHEVLVVDNNSRDETAAIARAKGARVVQESRKGYGHALRAGLDQAQGDVLLLTEADGTFSSKDVPKILEYLKDADLVIGTRTTRQMIEQGANMDWFLRWGNVAFGKLLQLLWWNHETRFTDVGCTFRGIWKEAYAKIRPQLQAEGPEFSPEMMLEALRAELRVIEIPVSYYKRAGGESQHSMGWKKVRTGLRMLQLMLSRRLQS